MPTELRAPGPMSGRRGAALPDLGAVKTVLVTSAPSWCSGTRGASSGPKQPDAGITGLRSRRGPSGTDRSTSPSRDSVALTSATPPESPCRGTYPFTTGMSRGCCAAVVGHRVCRLRTQLHGDLLTGGEHGRLQVRPPLGVADGRQGCNHGQRSAHLAGDVPQRSRHRPDVVLHLVVADVVPAVANQLQVARQLTPVGDGPRRPLGELHLVQQGRRA